VLPLVPVPTRDVAEVVPRGFVSFQYSYTEVSSHAGRTHVRSNRTQFADGKLTREAFEGELEGDAYRQMVVANHGNVRFTTRAVFKGQRAPAG
jgi:hypothetical protein